MDKDGLGPGYLKAEDFLVQGIWKEFTLTIKAVIPPNTVKSADGQLIDEPIVEFEQTAKKLVLNKTNQTGVKFSVGDGNTANWIGKSVTLYAARGNWFGQKNVAAIRVRYSGKTRPFVNAKNQGADLTGKKITE